MNKRWVLLAILWAMAVAAVVLLFQFRGTTTHNLRVNLDKVGPLQDVQIQADKAQISATTMLESPKFTGRDVQGRQWTLVAERAWRHGDVTQDVIELEALEAQMQTAKESLNIKAQKGTFQQAADVLQVEQNVQVKGYGLTLESPRVEMDLQTQNIKASNPVNVSGTFGQWSGTLKGKTLTFTSKSRMLNLSGPVKGVFQLNSKGETN